MGGLLILPGCGGGGGSGSNDVLMPFGQDDTGTPPKLVERFDKQSQHFKVGHRQMPADAGQFFNELRTQFQAGGGDIDTIVGDVIWPARFTANGRIADLTERFTDADEFLEGPMQSATHEDKTYAVPWYTDAGLLCSRVDLLEKADYSEPPNTWD